MRFERKEFMDLKKALPVLVQYPKSVQDTIEILRIAPSGIFQVSEKRFSKQYLFEDVNYVDSLYEEQLAFFEEWCKTLDVFDIEFKITIFNKYRDMQKLRDTILYQYKADGYDDIRVFYNDIIENKIYEAKQGIEQVKFLTVTVVRHDYEEAKTCLQSVEADLVMQFANLDSLLIPLSGNERLQVLHSFYKPDCDEYFDIDIADYVKTGRDWRNDIACNHIDFTSKIDSFRMDDRCCKAMYIDPKAYPNNMSDEFFRKLSNIAVSSVFSIDYVPIPKECTKKTLEAKYMGIEKKIQKQQRVRNRNKDFSSDISYPVRMAKRDIEEMLSDIQDNDQKMYWNGITFVLVTDSMQKLEAAVNTVNTIAEGKSFQISPLINWQREGLNTALPIGVRQIETVRANFTQTAAGFIPFEIKEVMMTKSPFYYGVNQISKNPILANRKMLMNGNGFIFGIPGSGKSLFGKVEIGSVYLNTNDDIIIIDPTLEYFEGLDAFHPTKLNLSVNAETYFNPFDFQIDLLQENLTEIVSEKSEIMLGICEQGMLDDLKQGHKSIIDRCVKRLLTNIAELPKEQWHIPIMSDFAKELEIEEKTEPMAHDVYLSMSMFIDGSLDLFNHETNIDIKNRLIIYGMRDLGKELTNISMLVMLENIRNRIIVNAKNGIATWLYCDEFHVLLKKKYSKMFFIDLFAQIRKWQGMATGLTQNISMVMNDIDMATLVANSEFTVFFKQAGKDVKFLTEYFESISKAQLKYVERALPGKGLIRFGNTVIPVDNTIDKKSPIYQMFNTNAHEKAAMKKLKENEDQFA
jgi:hypothetical protein